MDLFGDDPPATCRPHRSPGAARRAHAARAPSTSSSARRRCSRPGRPLREAIEHDRLQVDHPVGAARHRQDDAGARHRRRHARALHRLQRRAVGHQGDPRGDGGSRTGAGADPAAARFSSSTRSTASTRRSRTPSCPRVESGDIVLIGATTENPSFEVNSALLSRSKVYVLQPLDQRAIVTILRRALDDPERGLGSAAPVGDRRGAHGDRATYANGDARVALNMLELARRDPPASRADRPRRSSRTSRRAARCSTTRRGEEHYNLISALHKSMRNSDPGRVGLLAGAHAGSRRGSALCRAPAGALRVRRHRQRRPAGA